jgi:hypothetical protein
MKTLAAACACVSALVFAPTAHADGTCTFAAPVVLISLTAPITLVCGDGNTLTITHTTDVSVDPKLFSRAP